MEEHRTRLDIMQVENRQKDCQIKKLEEKVSSLRTQLETNQFDYDSVSSQIGRLQCKLDSLQQGCPPPVMICPPTLPRPVQQVMSCQQDRWEPDRSCTEVLILNS